MLAEELIPLFGILDQVGPARDENVVVVSFVHMSPIPVPLICVTLEIVIELGSHQPEGPVAFRDALVPFESTRVRADLLKF